MISIKEICYELYKQDWRQKHGITSEIKLHSIREYLRFCREHGCDKESYRYIDYLNQFGYNGSREIYACYEEFLRTEYLDDSYICSILKSENLITRYHNDIKFNKW